MRKFIKPKMITVCGRAEPELARLSYPRSNLELPEAGAMRPWVGREGGWWQRRVAEGSAEVTDPPPSAPASQTPVTKKVITKG